MASNENKYSKPPPIYQRIPRATHSFSHSPSCQQVFIILVFIASIVVYYVCIHSLEENWVLFGLYTFSLLVMIISYIITSCTDPTDRIVYSYKWHQQEGRQKKFQFQNNMSECEYCQSPCNQTSKHCRICDRCVNKFDHHCKWINNCIGQANYIPFLWMITSTLANNILFIVAGGIAIGSHINVKQNQDKVIPSIFIVVLLGIFSIFVLVLILFHIYFLCRGVTTYEYINEGKVFQKNPGMIQNNRKEGRENALNIQNVNFEQSMENSGTSVHGQEKFAQKKMSKSEIRKSEMKKKQQSRLSAIIGNLDVSNPKKTDRMFWSSIN